MRGVCAKRREQAASRPESTPPGRARNSHRRFRCSCRLGAALSDNIRKNLVRIVQGGRTRPVHEGYWLEQVNGRAVEESDGARIREPALGLAGGVVDALQQRTRAVSDFVNTEWSRHPRLAHAEPN